MRYDPSTEKSGVLPEGEYAAVVVAAEERVSKTGNDMIELKVAVYDAEGGEYAIDDYLVAGPRSLWKVRKFCEAAGLIYEAGSLEAAQCEGRSLRVSLVVEKQKGYPDRNKIMDYLPSNGAPRPIVAAARSADPDIPF